MVNLYAGFWLMGMSPNRENMLTPGQFYKDDNQVWPSIMMPWKAHGTEMHLP